MTSLEESEENALEVLCMQQNHSLQRNWKIASDTALQNRDLQIKAFTTMKDLR